MTQQSWHVTSPEGRRIILFNIVKLRKHTYRPTLLHKPSVLLRFSQSILARERPLKAMGITRLRRLVNLILLYHAGCVCVVHARAPMFSRAHAFSIPQENHFMAIETRNIELSAPKQTAA